MKPPKSVLLAVLILFGCTQFESRLPAIGSAEHSRKPTILHFWASWCPSCVHELYQLNSIAAIADDRGVSIIAVAIDDSSEAVHRITEQLHPKFPLILDDEGMWKARYGVGPLPMTLFLGSNGEKMTVPDPKTGELTSAIEGAIEWSPSNVDRIVEAMTVDNR